MHFHPITLLSLAAPLLLLLPAAHADVSIPLTTASGFTIPTSETSTPTTFSGTVITLPTEPNPVSTTSVASTATAANPSGSTGSLSGVATTTATGASASASATGAAPRGEGGSKVALVVALGMGVAGWIGL